MHAEGYGFESHLIHTNLMIMKRYILVFLLFSLISNISISQDTSKFSVNAGCDIVSRYIWRGQEYYNSPAFQPILSITSNGLFLTFFGSHSFQNTQFQESHTSIGWSNDLFSISLVDYYFYDAYGNDRYFKYDKNVTGHTLSIDASVTMSEEFPFTVLASYNIYGADTMYSNYIEMSYKNTGKIPLSFFVGFTGSDGWYGDGIGFVNTGISYNKLLNIGNVELPTYIKVIANPQKERLYIVFSVSL